MAHAYHTQRLARTEEALTVLFCLIDDAYAHLNPSGRRYEPLERLSDSEVVTLALLQQGFVGWSRSAPFCATPRGFSPTCSRGWWASTLRRSIAGFASSGVTWSL